MNNIIIPVAHDFICPWCWVGIKQARRLIEEEHVEISFLGFELFPLDMEWPPPSLDTTPPNRPKTLSRFQFLLEIEKMTIPPVIRPPHMRTHRAHLASEFAKKCDKGLEFVEAMYEAYWLEGKDIDSPEIFGEIGERLGLNRKKLIDSVANEQYAENLVGFDKGAQKIGIYNVPTFYIGDERLAEQPYERIIAALRRVRPPKNEAPYAGFQWPQAAKIGPYVIMEAATTLDGKLAFERDPESARFIGSQTDHDSMQNLIDSADALVMGANTARGALPSWAPQKPRFIFSNSGKFDFSRPIFQDGKTTIIGHGSMDFDHPETVKVISLSRENSMIQDLLSHLDAKGLRKIVLLGGGELNAQFLRKNLVDEIFLTLAPKIAGGRSNASLVGGEPLQLGHNETFELLDCRKIKNELFLRYRRILD